MFLAACWVGWTVYSQFAVLYERVFGLFSATLVQRENPVSLNVLRQAVLRIEQLYSPSEVVQIQTKKRQNRKKDPHRTAYKQT